MKKLNIEVKDFALGLLLGVSSCLVIYIYHSV